MLTACQPLIRYKDKCLKVLSIFTLFEQGKAVLLAINKFRSLRHLNSHLLSTKCANIQAAGSANKLVVQLNIMEDKKLKIILHHQLLDEKLSIYMALELFNVAVDLGAKGVSLSAQGPNFAIHYKCIDHHMAQDYE